jgi:hypothetical protein
MAISCFLSSDLRPIRLGLRQIKTTTKAWFILQLTNSQKREKTMSLEKHDLVHEFPEYREKIHNLKMNDAHFRGLFDQYHQVDHEILRLEQGVEVSSDDYLEEKKKSRLNLKDQLFNYLSA